LGRIMPNALKFCGHIDLGHSIISYKKLKLVRRHLVYANEVQSLHRKKVNLKMKDLQIWL